MNIQNPYHNSLHRPHPNWILQYIPQILPLNSVKGFGKVKWENSIRLLEFIWFFYHMKQMCNIVQGRLASHGSSAQHKKATQIAKFFWPKSGPHLTCSSGPHSVWNDGTWAVHSCLPEVGQNQAITLPDMNQKHTKWPSIQPDMGHCQFLSGPYLAQTWNVHPAHIPYGMMALGRSTLVCQKWAKTKPLHCQM